MPPEKSLEQILIEHTKEGVLYDKLPDNKVRCYACAHHCLIADGKRGVCCVRVNRRGTLYVPHGYVVSLACDPIEKKPFYHAYPGRDALSFGMLGCDYHCDFCQNWQISQALRDRDAGAPLMECSAKEIVDMAQQRGARVVSSTYNEPLITSEWAVEIFREARARGFATAYVSNGNGNARVLDYLRPSLDLFKVDLKGFDEKRYRQLGGQLQPVLETIRMLWEKKFWVEVVTLVIPGFNDSPDELRRIAKFLAGVSRDIPWHVSAFHPDYKRTAQNGTQAKTLVHACEIGMEEGLHFVYAGNLPGQIGKWENTYCPGCKELLIARRGFAVTQNRLANGACPTCSRPIPGNWGHTP